MTRTDRYHLGLMLVLTFTTGVNDAVGYLGLDKVFTGNMTGNVVVLGMGLVGDTHLPVLGPALALVGFMVGAATGGRVLRRVDTAWSRQTTVLFGAVGVLMFVIGGMVAVAGDHPSRSVAVTATTLAAVAMGLQAATARQVAVKDVTTVVVTSTITGLAADSPFGTGSSSAWRRRAGAVVLILVGALAGAMMLQWHLAAPMFLAAVLIVGAAVVGARA